MKFFYKIMIRIALFITILIGKFSYSSSAERCLPVATGLYTSNCWKNIKSPSLQDPYTPKCFKLLTHSTNLNYTVNFMWINAELNPNQKYICPYKDGEPALDTQFRNSLVRWARLHPYVNLWYDSKTTSVSAVAATKQLLNQAWNTTGENPILFKDIRELETVKAHPQHFCSTIPIFFRVDLLRIIATIESLNKTDSNYFVYIDIDVRNTLTPTALFNKDNTQHLSKDGLLLHTPGGIGNYENGFHIVSKEKKNILIALQHILVDFMMAWSTYAQAAKNLLLLPTRVYLNYPTMFRYFHHLEGKGKYWFKGPLTQPYDHNVHGVAPFGIEEDCHLIYNTNKGAPLDIQLPVTSQLQLPRREGNYCEDIK